MTLINSMAFTLIVTAIWLLLLNVSLTLCEETSEDVVPAQTATVNAHQEFPRGHLEKLGNQGKLLLDELPVLDYMIGGEDFYEHFMRKRQAVFFKGVTSNWAATRHWKNESYLLEKYADDLFDVEMGKVYEDSQHARKTMTLKEFLASYRVKTEIYLDSPFPQSSMVVDMEVPLMMQCEQLYARFSSAHMLFSNGDSSSPLHWDGYENFLTVMAGAKVVYVAHPKYGNDVYLDDFHDFPVISPINPERVDLIKYPKTANVPFHKITLQPGDMLYIPQGWIHQVRSYQSPNIGVSMWFHYFKKDQNLLASSKYSEENAAHQKAVNGSPRTIKCGNQALNMSLFSNLLLPNIGDKSAKSFEDKLVNNTVLYDPVSTGDAVMYVGSDDTWIYAIDINNGKIKWKVETREDTGSTCAFNQDASMVYCGADDSYMRAMHVENGSVVWAFKTHDRVISSAVVDREGVIHFGSLDGYMYALFPNGTLKWDTNVNGSIWSTPAIDVNKDLVYIASVSHWSEFNAFALRRENGEVVWKKFSRFGFRSSPKLNPLINELYLCDMGGNVYIFDTSTGNLKQRIDVNDTLGIWSTPAVDENGILFVASSSGKLIAYKIETEEILWQLEVGGQETAETCSSPYIGRNNILYMGSGNGTVFAIQPLTGDVKWRKDIASSIFFSSPRHAVNGFMYIGTKDGPLYALDGLTGDVKWTVKTNGPLCGTPLITREFI